MTVGFSTGSFTRIGPSLYRVNFDVGFEQVRFASGLEKLCFEYLYVLYTRKRSIPRSLHTGTGFRDLIGQLAAGSSSRGQVELAVMSETMDAESQVLASQATAKNLPDDERLQSVTVPSLTLDVAKQRVSVNLQITNILGRTVGFEVSI
jgi:hypothetical protein